jgi:hypothetical protein
MRYANAKNRAPCAAAGCSRERARSVPFRRSITAAAGTRSVVGSVRCEPQCTRIERGLIIYDGPSGNRLATINQRCACAFRTSVQWEFVFSDTRTPLEQSPGNDRPARNRCARVNMTGTTRLTVPTAVGLNTSRTAGWAICDPQEGKKPYCCCTHRCTA